jgi:hypothetical protein
MNFIDYTWDEIEGTFVKENILGSEFFVYNQNQHGSFYRLYS